MARFHDSEEAPLIKLRWYGTDLPFIDGVSIINSRDWDSEKFIYRPLGEVPTWTDPRRFNNAWTKPDGLDGKHYCFPADFESGEKWPVVHPDTEYDTDWIPTCCARKGAAAQGGIEIGGAAGDLLNTPSPTEGGLVIGGSAGDVLAIVDPTAGGVELGGAAGDVLSNQNATEGGIEIGGAAGDAVVINEPTEGGFELGGLAGDVWGNLVPLPGANCAAAPTLIEGVVYLVQSPAVPIAEQWFKYALVPNSVHHLNVFVHDQEDVFQIWVGAICATITHQSDVITGCNPTFAPAPGNMWLRYFSVFGTQRFYSFQLLPGACP